MVKHYLKSGQNPQNSDYNIDPLAAPEEALPADIRYTILCTAVSKGNDNDWNFLWQRYINAQDSPNEKKDILGALSCSKEIWILQVLFSPWLQGLHKMPISKAYA
jgi:hypothetical protein